MISGTYRVVENHHTVVSRTLSTEEQATKKAREYHDKHPGRYYEIQRFDPDQDRFIGTVLIKSRDIPFKWTVCGVIR